MTITPEKQGTELIMHLEGRLDTTTAPSLEAALKENLPGTTKLILDMENLPYISSAGLRVVLTAQKMMNRQGSMVVRGANPSVVEVFEITGFITILTLE